MNAYPIHDFLDESKYPLWEGIAAWRWEFLRRNADYQAAFERDGQTMPPPPSCRVFGLRSFPDPRMEYPQVSSHFHSGGSLSQRPIPTLADLETWRSRPGFDPERALRSVLWSVEERLRMGLHFAMIDLTVPLRPQFAAIEKLAQARPVVERMHPEKWRGYLRVLDGAAKGLDADAVAAVMHPNESNEYASGYAPRRKVEQALARARELCLTFAIRTADPEK